LSWHHTRSFCRRSRAQSEQSCGSFARRTIVFIFAGEGTVAASDVPRGLWIYTFESSFPGQPPRSPEGEFLLSAKRRHFRRLAARSLARATNFGLLRAGLRHAEWAALLRERRAVDARRVRASHPSPSDLRPSRYFGFHSRASFSASAICAGVIFAATISRRITASVSPLAAAKLNHMCAVT
jgi:hypothetical protein